MVEESISAGKGLKSISNELATAINDGLYFYEQVQMPVLYLLQLLAAGILDSFTILKSWIWFLWTGT